MKIAIIILNRNLYEPTNKLVEHIYKYDGKEQDIYVVEAGSDKNRLSKYCSWHIDSEEVKRKGLRYNRGMNYGLLKLYEENKWDKYDAFLLLTNDTLLRSEPTLKILGNVLEKNPKVGILSPVSKKWGERFLLDETKIKYFWHIHNNAYVLRRKFIEDIMEREEPSYLNFCFDGTNFRGYLTENELIAKAYTNDWAAAITSEVYAEHKESYLLNSSKIIKTESYEENMKLYIEEGNKWLKRKYGFNSRWTMIQYVKLFYDKFFDLHPEYKEYKL
tara:strand:+ start:574 stop:1395 length:822 start_codon:yes stop_codon:yes gene_type:complete